MFIILNETYISTKLILAGFIVAIAANPQWTGDRATDRPTVVLNSPPRGEGHSVYQSSRLYPVCIDLNRYLPASCADWVRVVARKDLAELLIKLTSSFYINKQINHDGSTGHRREERVQNKSSASIVMEQLK